LNKFNTAIRGGDMLPDTLKYLNLDELTDRERAELTKALRAQKQYLEALLRSTDRNLKALARKGKRKRTSKRGPALKR
jgi:hypothetical protein